MPRLDVDGLQFDFPAGWQAAKHDDGSFYRGQFSRMWNGIKAVDIVAVDPARTVWFIEVKDYRVHTRTKPTDLADEVARKVFDTLASLLPAQVNANEPGEKGVAGAALRATRLRVVLHLEQPKKHSAMRPRAIDPTYVEKTLRRLIKPIDAHPFVAETCSMGSLPWRVT